MRNFGETYLYLKTLPNETLRKTVSTGAKLFKCNSVKW